MTGLTIPFTGLKKQYNNLRSEILDATDEVLRSGNLMDGNWTAEFEYWLAQRNGSRHAICCHSGTSALEVIAEFYGTENSNTNFPTVLIPSLTYAATANAFMRAGWNVHFVDVDSQGIFDCRRVPDIRYQAVVLVGLYGAAITHLGDMKFWRQSMLKDTIVIEDGAQHWLADGAARMGQATAISFDPMKNLPSHGNGGAVVTNDTSLASYVRQWQRNGKPNNTHTGTNNRMSELDCAHMIVKTRYLDKWQARRKKISDYWRERLKGSSVRTLINDDNAHDHSYHKFVIDVDHRNELQKALSVRKIETRVHYEQPLHEIGCFRQWPGPDMLSSATALSRRVLSLPFYPELTDLEVEYIIDQVKDCVSQMHN